MKRIPLPSPAIAGQALGLVALLVGLLLLAGLAWSLLVVGVLLLAWGTVAEATAAPSAPPVAPADARTIEGGG